MKEKLKENYFLLFLLFLVGAFLINIFKPFLMPIFISILLIIATNSLYDYFNIKFNNTTSSILVTLFLAILFFAPIVYFIIYFSQYLLQIDQEKIIATFVKLKFYIKNLEIPQEYIYIKTYLVKFLNDLNIAGMLKNIFSIGANIGKNSLSFLSNIFLILVFFFIFSYYRKNLFNYLKELIPLDKYKKEELFVETSSVVGVVFYSILVTAVFEGLLFGIFISFFNYNGLLLGILYGFASLIPVIGGILMWLPISIYEFFNTSFQDSLIIALYSIIVISIIADTFIKPIIIKFINEHIIPKQSKINELLIFFAMVAGITSLGFWGVIIAPAMVAFLISILNLIKISKK